MATNEATKPPKAAPTPGSFFIPQRQLIRGLIILIVAVLSMHTNNFSAGTKFTIHLLSFSSFYGCSVWVTFIAGIVMFKNMPRHAFGRLQAKLFPKYFQFSTVTIGFSILLMHSELTKKEQKQFTCLCAIMIITLINLLFIEPKTTSIMYERHVIERKLGTGHEVGQIKPSDPNIANDPELKDISKRFGMFHGISSSLSLLSVCLATWHLIFIGSKLEL